MDQPSQSNQHRRQGEPEGKPKGFFAAFGPGLLFAGTAIGLSHLVQSTVAGALYGFGLVGVILLIHLFKYPMFRWGAYYPAVTGESLVAGYRRQGLYAVFLLLAVLLSYMFFALGAVGLLSAALIQTALGLDFETKLFAACILAGAALFLIVGRYHWLERVNKVLMVVLALSTFLAAAMSLPNVEWVLWSERAGPIDLRLLIFVAAMGGFMPCSADSSVWQSLWTIEKAKETGSRPRLSHVLGDFNIGFWGAAFFALCFLIMGTASMHSEGIEPALEAGPFAAQVLSLYENSLGSWAVPLVSASVISVMLTTTLAGLDALPRVLVAITQTLREKAPGSVTQTGNRFSLYTLYVPVLALGAIAAIYLMGTSFRTFLNFGTTVATLVAPVIATFNHRAVFGPNVPEDKRPGEHMRRWSLCAIMVLTAFTLCYLYLMIGGYFG